MAERHPAVAVALLWSVEQNNPALLPSCWPAQNLRRRRCRHRRDSRGRSLLVHLASRPTLSASRHRPRAARWRRLGPDGLNLLVITLDTTRADRIGAYGYNASRRRPRPPGARGCPVRPDHGGGAADAAGALQHLHGALPAGARRARQRRLLPLAQADDAGHGAEGARSRTGAVVGCVRPRREMGTQPGLRAPTWTSSNCPKYAGFGLGEMQRPANEVVDRAMPWLEKVKGQRFFAWLHFYDPHTPYEPPEPFAIALRRAPVPRRDRLHRLADRPRGRRSSSATA